MQQTKNKSTWPFTAVIAPEGCSSYLTPGKRYELVNYFPNEDIKCTLFNIIDDTGYKLVSLIYESAHLIGNDWILCKD